MILKVKKQNQLTNSYIFLCNEKKKRFCKNAIVKIILKSEKIMS